MDTIQIISEKAVVDNLSNLAQKATQRIWIATPYIGNFKTVSSVLGRKCQIESFKQGIRFLVDVGERGNYRALNDIERFADIKTLRGLHAKIYIFDNVAIVATANLTRTSLTKRYEAAVILRKETDVNKVVKIFEEWWDEKAGEVKKIPKKKKSLGSHEEPGGNGLKELWEMQKPPVSVDKKASKIIHFHNAMKDFKKYYKNAIKPEPKLTKLPSLLEVDNFFDYLFHHDSKQPSKKYKDKDRDKRSLKEDKRVNAIKTHIPGYQEYLGAKEGKGNVKGVMKKRKVHMEILKGKIDKKTFWELLGYNWSYQANERFLRKEVEQNKPKAIKDAFNHLLDENDDFDLRIRRCQSMLKGIGPSIISEMLAFYDPKYPVMNGPSLCGLRMFGYDV